MDWVSYPSRGISVSGSPGWTLIADHGSCMTGSVDEVEVLHREMELTRTRRISSLPDGENRKISGRLQG